jgi:predicted protein tyrosine phosphatase
MITRFTVLCRTEAERAEMPSHPHLIVSISTPGEPEAQLRTNTATCALVQLQFHDFDDRALIEISSRHPDAVRDYEPRCFSPVQARQVLDAIKQHPHAEELIVHCDAGLSRSPGVAAALSKILTGDDRYFFSRYHPNMRVYRTLLEEHYYDFME